ncbi:uncharacterized protein IUM83_19944 [Phytophthora cinnamomi]|uniref:uncharacterized protein n=1 Tax=Phytophthora cinnamomi TaxID=4785 RepID=UPI003559D9F6|nr:hypothetical protein IUM83_19944 [Phytophthora cinnamomi]
MEVPFHSPMAETLQSQSRHQTLPHLSRHFLKPVLLHMNHQGSPLSHYRKMSPQLKPRQEEVPPQLELRYQKPPGQPSSLYPEVSLPTAPPPATAKS